MLHNNNHKSGLWHRKFAHLHYEALLKLKKLVSIILDVQASHDGVRLGCASGNKTRGPFPSNKNKTDDIIQFIHSDLCGPMMTLIYYLI